MSVEKFAKLLPLSGALLGLDLGVKTIGLAVSDARRNLALPLKTISRTKLKNDIETLKKIIVERQLAGLILGLPLNMDGSEGPRAQSTRTFASKLQKEVAVPLAFWDERLSTHEAGLALKEAGISHKKQDGKIDAAAATVILQDALDRLRALKP